MIVAALIRNWHDRPKKDGKPASLEDAWIEEIGSAALSYFLVLATLTLRLSQLSSLAGTLMLILAVQAVVVWVIASQVVYRLSGKDYDAAVMGGGFVGFMLGTTANAMANMEAVTRRYGPAPRAYLVVPLVGACFVDFVNATVITLCLQFFGSA
jgi:ESS family glutamate:Na+ symporter